MVSFAHVRTQAHDIFISQAGLAAVSAEKQKRPDIRIMDMFHDPDVRPFGDSLGLVQTTDPLLGTSVLCAPCQKLLASLYRKAPLFLASR